MSDIASALGISGASTAWMGIASVVVQLLEFCVPVAILASSQPRRDHLGGRIAVALLGLTCMSVLTMLGSSVGVFMPDAVALRYSANFVTYSAFLLAIVPAILLCVDTSVWNAFFYVTVGYTIQNLGAGAAETLRILAGAPIGQDAGIMWLYVVPSISVAASIAICWRPFLSRAREAGRLDERSSNMLLMAVLVILVVIANDVVIRALESEGDTNIWFVLVLRLTHVAICAFVLYSSWEVLVGARLAAEVEQAERMAAERERQYALSRENIDAINLKCHDIRHQIRHLADGVDGGTRVDSGILEDIAREIDVYDSLVRTGNDALDTILSEKSLLCSQEGITLTCIADGAALDFLPAAEIYSLFGNALDNAIRAARELDDPDRRTISLNIQRVGDLATVHVANFCAAMPTFTDGMPQTTQADHTSHGFGTRSMRSIVERHGGTITFSTAGDTFTVDALIPRER